MSELDLQGAEANFRRGIELSPGHATAHQWFGDFLTFVLRRFEEGAAELDLALELDPLSPIIQNDCGLALLHRGHAADAMKKFAEALALDATFWRAQYDIGIAHFLNGNPELGVDHLERAWRMGGCGAPGLAHGDGSDAGDWRARLERKVKELGARHDLRAFEAALVSMLLDRRDDALRWLHAVENEGSWALVMQYFPAFRPLYGDATFASLLRTAGLYHFVEDEVARNPA